MSNLDDYSKSCCCIRAYIDVAWRQRQRDARHARKEQCNPIPDWKWRRNFLLVNGGPRHDLFKETLYRLLFYRSTLPALTDRPSHNSPNFGCLHLMYGVSCVWQFFKQQPAKTVNDSSKEKKNDCLNCRRGVEWQVSIIFTSAIQIRFFSPLFIFEYVQVSFFSDSLFVSSSIFFYRRLQTISCSLVHRNFHMTDLTGGSDMFLFFYLFFPFFLCLLWC